MSDSHYAISGAGSHMLLFPSDAMPYLVAVVLCAATLGLAAGFFSGRRLKWQSMLWIAVLSVGALALVMALSAKFDWRYIHLFEDTGAVLPEPLRGCPELQEYKRRVAQNSETDWATSEWARILETSNCRAGADLALLLSALLKCISAFLMGLILAGAGILVRLSVRRVNEGAVLGEQMGDRMLAAQPQELAQGSGSAASSSYDQLGQNESLSEIRNDTGAIDVAPPESLQVSRAKSDQKEQSPDEMSDIATRRLLENVVTKFHRDEEDEQWRENAKLFFKFISSETKEDNRFLAGFVGKKGEGRVRVTWRSFMVAHYDSGTSDYAARQIFLWAADFTGLGLRRLLSKFVAEYDKAIAEKKNLDPNIFGDAEEIADQLRFENL